LPKLQKNIERDAAKTRILESEVWKVIHVWEHGFKDLQGVVARIVRELSLQLPQ
jgi:G:T-mismatch repair DNA endonuclease (very short patch repair protein)